MNKAKQKLKIKENIGNYKKITLKNLVKFRGQK